MVRPSQTPCNRLEHMLNFEKNKTFKQMENKMDFELTKSQKEIQKAARDFAKGEFDKDLALELDKKHEFPEKI